jgi:hypothetical protein
MTIPQTIPTRRHTTHHVLALVSLHAHHFLSLELKNLTTHEIVISQWVPLDPTNFGVLSLVLEGLVVSLAKTKQGAASDGTLVAKTLTHECQGHH